jgi:hypothetical protein
MACSLDLPQGLPKKSSSTCCWPILRSSSAIRLLAAPGDEMVGFVVVLRTTLADAAFGGRPRRAAKRHNHRLPAELKRISSMIDTEVPSTLPA